MAARSPIRRARRYLAAATLFAASICAARGAELSEVAWAVKATYLYKFAPFVEWPESAFASPSSPVYICVVGDEAFGRLVARAVAGQRMGGRDFAVRTPSVVEQTTGCHVMYVAGGGPPPADVLATMRGRPVLTVTDAIYRNAARGVIHFVIHGGRVRFVVDLHLAGEQGLAISSKVLEIALHVKER